MWSWISVDTFVIPCLHDRQFISSGSQCALERTWAVEFNDSLLISEKPIERKQAFGRIAFAVAKSELPKIEELMKTNDQTILTNLITLDTPGKASVTVVILADPDGHEICFVDEEGFTELSKVDPQGEVLVDRYMKKEIKDAHLIHKKEAE